MDKPDKIILEGVFTEFPRYTINRPYTDDDFWASDLKKIKLENRNKKINKILNNIK